MDSVEWRDLYRNYHKILQELPFEDITLPHAGESFVDDSPGECADRLETLAALGYYVPQYAIDALRDEQAALVSEEQRDA